MHARHARRASTIGDAVGGQWSTRCVARTRFSDMCAHAGDPAAASFARPSALTADLSSQILLGAESSHQELSGAVFVFFLSPPLRGLIYERVPADYRARTTYVVQNGLGVRAVSR